jgi:hypothetical protein
VEVQSAPDCGSIFGFILPRRQAARDATATSLKMKDDAGPGAQSEATT